ncbi:hypothetical protein BGX33_010272 [Mortierella sp. NVP41]|nr:hypothetical protein BGX33_010272 [Mortierella sp. NVP41]
MKITIVLSALIALGTILVAAAPVEMGSTITVGTKGDSRWNFTGTPPQKSIKRPVISPISRAGCKSITLIWGLRRYKGRPPSETNHFFDLKVETGYYNEMETRPSTGVASNHYWESRSSNDGKWSITHYDETQPIEVGFWANGHDLMFYKENYQDGFWARDSKGEYYDGFMEFWQCIPWYT